MTINLNKVTKVIPAEAAKAESICAAIALSVATLAITGLAAFGLWIAAPRNQADDRTVSE